VVVLTLAGYDELHGDLEFIGEIAEFPDLAKSVDGIIAFATQFQGLTGLDKSKPLGVGVTTDGVQFQPLAFVPVTDLKKLFGALAGNLGKPTDAGDGIWEIEARNVSVF